MKTLEEVLKMEARIDRATLEEYIERKWLKPIPHKQDWQFEEIDIARMQLVYHLTEKINVNDEGIDIVLSLMDQLYGTRALMRNIAQAINKQTPDIQAEIMAIIAKGN